MSGHQDDIRKAMEGAIHKARDEADASLEKLLDEIIGQDKGRSFQQANEKYPPTGQEILKGCAKINYGYRS